MYSLGLYPFNRYRLCTLGHVLVCTPRVAARRAHSSEMVDDMLVTLSPGHKYYITILYLKLQWYCWDYKSKLNIIYKSCISPILQVIMYVRLGDQIRIIQFTNYLYDRIL